MLDRIEELNEYALGERRSHDWFQRSLALIVDEAGATNMVTTENISARGLYLYTKSELAVGAVLMMRLPHGDDDLIIVSAQVIHSNLGHGAEVRFVSLRENDRVVLEAYGKQYTAMALCSTN